MNNVKILSPIPETEKFHFSICSIVANPEEYQLMKDSFVAKGFTDDCEYIIADNSAGNQFDAYQAIARFIKTANGRYIIVVHQDVRCIDERAQLENCLQELTNKDKAWAVCGNAGAKGYHDAVVHITGTRMRETYEGLPVKVNSLDENFLVLNAHSNISISWDLSGYHLYGTDICIVAQVLGHTCYVIPFMVLHLSEGNVEDLKKYVPGFVQRYGDKLNFGYIQTTCTKFFLGRSARKNKWLNSPFIFFLIKQTKRWPFLVKKIGKQNKRTKEWL